MGWLRGLKGSPSLWFAPMWLVLLLPSLDFTFSRAFYDDVAGFARARSGILEIVRSFGPGFIIGSLAVCVMVSLVNVALKRGAWRIASRQIAYLGVTLLIGPGLIVETLLKPHWGRARPRDISDFGGALHYTPAWELSDQCSSNCSFVSGHAAVAFWLTAYAFVLPPAWRWPVMGVGILLGFAMGFVRIAQGAHFISDIATAGFLVVLVNEIVARRMFADTFEK